jgi:hypothetical protein
MANANFTGIPAAQGCKGSREPHLPQHELEKISCSLASLGESELLDLRGKRIRVLQRIEHLPVSRFIAQVMAVQLPAFGSSVATAVLILEDGYSSDQLDYVDASDLTLLEVLE